MRADRLNHASAIRQHLDALDLQHRPVLHDSLNPSRSDIPSREEHTESRRRWLDTPSDHETVPRLEDMQNRGHARECQGTNKDRRLEPSVSLVLPDRKLAFGIFVGESGFDWHISLLWRDRDELTDGK